jgi:membrane-associated protease RseP (regulator of RpoE activity)
VSTEPSAAVTPPRAEGGRFPWINAALFAATLVTTVVAGAEQAGLREPTVGGVILAGAPFAASLVAILLTHEMGHYFLARRHRVDSTLPYFIPFPSVVGTLGAVIRLRSPIPSRKAVLEIGAAGPIAGFLVAVPLYAWGLAHSRLVAIPAGSASNFGSPLALIRSLIAGQELEMGTSGFQLMGDSLVTWAVGKLAVGSLPAGTDVVVHPVAFAAWLGLFVTAINLLPIGQLDGGHVTYALFGRDRALLFSRWISRALLLVGLVYSWTWVVWWIVTRFFLGMRHPPALSEEPLTPGQRVIAWLSLALFAATFIPVPFSV